MLTSLRKGRQGRIQALVVEGWIPGAQCSSQRERLVTKSSAREEPSESASAVGVCSQKIVPICSTILQELVVCFSDPGRGWVRSRLDAPPGVTETDADLRGRSRPSRPGSLSHVICLFC